MKQDDVYQPLLDAKPGEYADTLEQLKHGVAFAIDHLDQPYLEALGIENPKNFQLTTTFTINNTDAPRIRNFKVLLNCAYHINNILTRLENQEYKAKIVLLEIPGLLMDLRHLKISTDVELIKTFLSKNYLEFYRALNEIAPKLEQRLGLNDGAIGGNNHASLAQKIAAANQEQPKEEFSNFLLEAMAHIDEYIVEKADIKLPTNVEYFDYNDNEDTKTNSLKAVLNIMRRTGKIVNLLENGVSVDENETWASVKSTEGYRYYAMLQQVMSISEDFDRLDKDYVAELFQKLFKDSMEKTQNLLFNLAFSIDQFEADMGLTAGTIFDKFEPVFNAYFLIDPTQSWATLHDARQLRRETALQLNNTTIAKRLDQIAKIENTRKNTLASDEIADPTKLNTALVDELCDLFDIDTKAENKIAQLIQLCDNTLIEKVKETPQVNSDNAEEESGVIAFFGRQRRNLTNFVYHKVGLTADNGYEFCHQMANLLSERKHALQNDVQQLELTNKVLQPRIDTGKVVKIEAAFRPVPAQEHPVRALYQNPPPASQAPHQASAAPDAKSGGGVKEAFRILGQAIRAFFKDVFRAIGNFFKRLFGIKTPQKTAAIEMKPVKSSYAKVLEQAPADSVEAKPVDDSRKVIEDAAEPKRSTPLEDLMDFANLDQHKPML